MKITNIDTIMAHSLRSLAGFCMGEYGKKELEIILLQLLSSIKKNSHTSSPQYCSI